jgi:hypothetical protein
MLPRPSSRYVQVNYVCFQRVLSDATREVWLFHMLVVGHICTSVRVSAATSTYLISEIN